MRHAGAHLVDTRCRDRRRAASRINDHFIRPRAFASHRTVRSCSRCQSLRHTRRSQGAGGSARILAPFVNARRVQPLGQLSRNAFQTLQFLGNAILPSRTGQRRPKALASTVTGRASHVTSSSRSICKLRFTVQGRPRFWQRAHGAWPFRIRHLTCKKGEKGQGRDEPLLVFPRAWGIRSTCECIRLPFACGRPRKR